MNLLLRNRQPPGDVLMLTAAVRDLHRACPGAYSVAVDTSNTQVTADVRLPQSRSSTEDSLGVMARRDRGGR